MHLPYAVCVPWCLGLLAVRGSAMVNNSNNSSRSSPPDESRIPQRRVLACEGSGVPGDSAPGERNFQRERAFPNPVVSQLPWFELPDAVIPEAGAHFSDLAVHASWNLANSQIWCRLVTDLPQRVQLQRLRTQKRRVLCL